MIAFVRMFVLFCLILLGQLIASSVDWVQFFRVPNNAVTLKIVNFAAYTVFFFASVAVFVGFWEEILENLIFNDKNKLNP